MATHSHILAWKITWTEEPGELQSMGLQRVGHDSTTDNFHLILMTIRHFINNRQNIGNASGTIIEATGEFENIH